MICFSGLYLEFTLSLKGEMNKSGGKIHKAKNNTESHIFFSIWLYVILWDGIRQYYN